MPCAAARQRGSSRVRVAGHSLIGATAWLQSPLLSRELPRQLRLPIAESYPTSARSTSSSRRSNGARLRMAELATGNRDEALDLVQDAMFGFVRHYADKPAGRMDATVLSRARQPAQRLAPAPQVRGRWIAAFVRDSADDEADRALRRRPIRPIRARCCVWPATRPPRRSTAHCGACRCVNARPFCCVYGKVSMSPTTAATMRCSEGSVKTHLSRALAALRRALEDHQ